MPDRAVRPLAAPATRRAAVSPGRAERQSSDPDPPEPESSDPEPDPPEPLDPDPSEPPDPEPLSSSASNPPERTSSEPDPPGAARADRRRAGPARGVRPARGAGPARRTRSAGRARPVRVRALRATRRSGSARAGAARRARAAPVVVPAAVTRAIVVSPAAAGTVVVSAAPARAVVVTAAPAASTPSASAPVVPAAAVVRRLRAGAGDRPGGRRTRRRRARTGLRADHAARAPVALADRIGPVARDGDRRHDGARGQHGHRAGLRQPGARRSAPGGCRSRRARACARQRQPGHERQRDDRRGGGAQAGPGTVHELAHRPAGEPQVARDLLLAGALQRRAQQRVALALGQGGDRRQRLAHDLPALELVRRTAGGPQRLGQRLVVVAGHPQRVQGRVARDPEQPRPQLAHLVAAPQAAPGRDERLLEGIFRPRLGQDPPARAQQRPPVALDDDLEGPVGALAGERDQPLVGLGAQQRRRRGDHRT